MVRRAGAVLLSCLWAMSLGACGASASVEISSKPTVNMTCSGGVCTPTAKKAVLNVNDLASMLASGDTVIKSTSQNPDIEIDAALSWTSTSRMMLDSYHAIAFNKPVEVTGTGALTITTNDGGTGGDFRFFGKGHVEFSDLHSSLIINGHPYRLFGSIKTFERALRDTDGSGQFFALQKSMNTRRIYSTPPIDKTFNGTFEGLGNRISNLTIQSNTGDAGLFLTIETSGTVRDLRLEDVSISEANAPGAFIGALASGSGGTILNCDASGRIAATGTQSIVGGLIGGNIGLVSASSSSVIVSANGNDSVVGGLAGENTGSDDGGIGFIHESYASGAVTGGDGTIVGGLAGKNDSAGIYDSFATGSITGGNGTFVGGLIGDHAATNFSPVLRRSYSTGAVTGGSGATVGGLIGEDLAGTRTTHAYWDLDTSGISDPGHGAGNIQNDPGITGLSDAQLKSGLPAGFDKKVWREKATLDSGYPTLIDNPPPKK